MLIPGDAGIIDQDVDRSERRLGLLDERFDLSGVGDIARRGKPRGP